MALNIKDPYTVQLATEVAALAGGYKTLAVRQALAERKERLLLARSGGSRGARMIEVLERVLWPQLARWSLTASIPSRKGSGSGTTPGSSTGRRPLSPRA
ncbi:MAG: type II toxin-antitoxin system VapB family antitoxin, partial [Chloroflexi bacterium]|nr:type II toxin-antitoxin system VapB family antitoxin [Chloroflexota bacterium]